MPSFFATHALSHEVCKPAAVVDAHEFEEDFALVPVGVSPADGITGQLDRRRAQRACESETARWSCLAQQLELHGACVSIFGDWSRHLTSGTVYGVWQDIAMTRPTWSSAAVRVAARRFRYPDQMRWISPFAVLGLIAACPGGTIPIDGTGTYTQDVAWGAGDCAKTGIETETFVVTEGPTGDVISESDPATLSGSLDCTSHVCAISLDRIEPRPGGEQLFVFYNLTLGEDDVVVGSAMAEGMAGTTTTCTQTASVSGNRL